MSFIRKIKKGKNVYLALVENRRIKGKVVQKVIKYIGKEINGKVTRRVGTRDVQAEAVKQYADVLVIHRLATILGLDRLFKENRYVLAFVYSHLLERPSIRRLDEWFSHTEIPAILELKEISTAKLYETLGELSEMDFSRIEEDIFVRLRVYERDKFSAIIDVTDTYFEGGTINEKPRRGKDGKYRKLLQVGLGVTGEYGFPILMETYPGNVSNLMIFKDLFVRLQKKGFRALIIDRGMGSEENIKEVLKARMSIICGLRKTPALIKKYLVRVSREEIYCVNNRVKLKNTNVYAKEFSYLTGKLVVVYNPHLEMVRREIIYERSGTDDEARYVGYSFIYHNTLFSLKEVVRKYYEKEIVDRAFMKLKGILSLRPVRVWLKEHIEGHLRVCYLSYAILALFDYYLKKFDISALEFLEKLKGGYKIYLKDAKSNFSWETTVVLERKLYKILNYLNVVYKKG
jgi:transposase